MSLLMDALKRAETAKRQNADLRPTAVGRMHEAAAGVGEMSLEADPPSPLPDLADHLASVDAELRATADADRRPRVSSYATDRSAAPGPTPTVGDQPREVRRDGADTPAPGRRTIVVLAAVGWLAALAISGYYYMRYQQLADPGRRLTATPVAQPERALPPVAAEMSPSAPARTPAAPPPPPLAAPATATVGLGAAPVPTVGAAPPGTHSPTRPANPADSPIRVSASAPQLDPALVRAYQSLQASDFDGARGAYEQVLRGDPRNADALTGLGAMAGRAGQTDRAQALYLQALETDPKNVAALTGLIGLHGPDNSPRSESRLKSLLAGRAPDSTEAGMIHFALGNLFAAQRRWNEAQNAYFQAFTTDGGNPDYHYNLAVSLDHLQQTRLAAQYYRTALAAAEHRPAAFERAQIEARLAELPR